MIRPRHDEPPAGFIDLAARGAEVGVAPGVHRKHGQDPRDGVGDDVILASEHARPSATARGSERMRRL